MSINSITVIKVIVSKATCNNDFYQWEDPKDLKREAVKSYLNKIANHLEKQTKACGHSEKISFSVANTMPIADPTVSLAINMHCTLSSLTLEQWVTIGENIKRSLENLFSKINKLAASNTHVFPHIIVKDPMQMSMLSEKINNKAIAVASEQEKGILRNLINLAQSNNIIKYEINGAESSLQTLPIIVSEIDVGEPINTVVYVTYYDYLNKKFGIVIKSKNKRIVELTCRLLAQREKLYIAYKLKCEVRVELSTEIVKKDNGKTEEKVTGILKVIEMSEDKKCPLQEEFDF
jgi:hypothetical protein